MKKISTLLALLILILISSVNLVRADCELVEGWVRYHITPFSNIQSIVQTGLDPQYGGDPSKKGMSYMYDQNPNKDRRYSDKFKRGSKGYVHVSKTWESTKQYVTHMIVLWGKQNKLSFKSDKSHQLVDFVDSIPDNLSDAFLESMPVILKTDINRYELSIDQDDLNGGLKTLRNIPPHKIFIAVINKNKREELNQPDDALYQRESFWLPISEWDSVLYEPAYPEEDNNVIKINSQTAQQMLLDRIVMYARRSINKSEAASTLGVCSKTLTKFLQGCQTVRESTKRKIISNFARNFSYFTRYDHHWIN